MNMNMNNLKKCIQVVGVAGVCVGALASCAEGPKYADPEEVKKADENRIRAIQNNPHLTPAQKEWQINRIKGQIKQPRS
jgi:hypothetical protein